jgi:hypothetical protein
MTPAPFVIAAVTATPNGMRHARYADFQSARRPSGRRNGAGVALEGGFGGKPIILTNFRPTPSTEPARTPTG